MEGIAITGLGCRYPDAANPSALWEMVLAQRQAFRRIPPERLPLADYGGVPADEDLTCATRAAVLTDWTFDRVRYRVARATHATVDPSHWLALECADSALQDAGFAGGAGLPATTTAVIVGNSLTGDYSRAAALRLRWPYVRRTVEAALEEAGVDAARAALLLTAAERRFKQSLPPANAETLAGWLSNTIAGRICNHFDFGGGGYVVDGACSSSLLAITTACDALRARTADVVLAGGVDLSLDPLELVGFARAQALTTGEMLVYDRDSSGFIPGEGCGFAVLMREGDARALGCRIYACVRGWGVASDGHGGITRPEVPGQRRALQRAYRTAGFGIDTVGYFEGHGTGTSVGDAAEITALTEERHAAGARACAVLGSIKANVGHTKAAAGIAGFIKATLALHTRTVPPSTGCLHPSPLLLAADANLRIVREASPWPSAMPLRASVSAMGFGGINTHVALEGFDGPDPGTRSLEVLACRSSAQDVEVFPLTAADADAMLLKIRSLRERAGSMSRAELTDAAVALQQNREEGRVRAAVIAAGVPELEAGCVALEKTLRSGRVRVCSVSDGAFLGVAGQSPRIALLFPGQGSPTHRHGGLWRRRFSTVGDLFGPGEGEGAGDTSDTRVAQPAIVRASLAGLRLLRQLGINATAGLGHSLGELCALHWGEGLDEAALLRIVHARANAMGDHGARGGGMVSVGATPAQLSRHLNGGDVVIAATNGPAQTIVAGPLTSVQPLSARLAAAGFPVRRLPVSHAFHSPGMSGAARAFAAALAGEPVRTPARRVISTITARAWRPDDDPGELLVRQLTAPVRFLEALAALHKETDLFIETGPGNVLAGLVTAAGVPAPVVSLDAGSESLRGLLAAAAAAFTLGAPVRWPELARDRFARPFDFERLPQVLISPCEAFDRGPQAAAPESAAVAPADLATREKADTPDDLARRLVATRAELPVEAVQLHHRLLSDLHLNSLTSTQLVVDLARALEVALPKHPIEYADASLETIVRALLAGGRSGAAIEPGEPTGVASWVRTFRIEWHDEDLSGRPLSGLDSADATVTAQPGDPMLPALRRILDATGTSGNFICLPERPAAADVVWLTRQARLALAADGPVVIVQRDGGGGAFARSLWLEHPDRDVLVANLHGDEATALRMLVNEVRHLSGFREVRLGEGTRQVPCAGVVEWQGPRQAPLDRDGVLLVTGGGKGIAAEGALALASRFGLRLGILGRSDPAHDADLHAGLDRLRTKGVAAHYTRCDVADPDAVRRAVVEIEKELGPIRGVLHGAGINDPALLTDLDEDTIARTLAIKVDGLANVLAAIDAPRLRLCIAFGSLTARTGMRGDAHYAAANELMVRVLGNWSSAQPQCRCLALEWSVWAGTGMGARLGRLAALERSGITPLTIEQGTAVLCALAETPGARDALIVSGRFPQGPTLRLAGDAPPAWRFLERPVAWYPGVELVADADLSTSNDLFIDDHVVGGERIFPGVFGLEAMTQAAVGLVDPDCPLDVELTGVAFDRPIVVPPTGSRRIRIAALRVGDAVDVVIRSDESAFAVDHFRARVRFVRGTWGADPFLATVPAEATIDAAPLYGDLLFQGGRFRRVSSYAGVHATSCAATLTPPVEERWFSSFLPDTLVLGDPGARDALMHAVQPCVPELTLLPTGADRISVRRGAVMAVVSAAERSSDGKTFVYDAVAADASGRTCERWEGLQFRALGSSRTLRHWLTPAMAPIVERAITDFVPSAAARVFVRSAAMHGGESGRAVAARIIGRPIDRRPDGQPQFADGEAGSVSIAHDADLLLAIWGTTHPVACDLQVCRPRAVDGWRALLGAERCELAQFLATMEGEPFDIAATRIWCAIECLKKCGAAFDTRIAFQRSHDRWVALAAGCETILTREFTRGTPAISTILAVLCGPHARALEPAVVAPAAEIRI